MELIPCCAFRKPSHLLQRAVSSQFASAATHGVRGHVVCFSSPYKAIEASSLTCLSIMSACMGVQVPASLLDLTFTHCSATCHLPSVVRQGTSWSLVASLAQRELNFSHSHSCPGLCFLTSSYSFESRQAPYRASIYHFTWLLLKMESSYYMDYWDNIPFISVIDNTLTFF